MSTFLKAEKVVSTALGLLLRELTLSQLVWRDAAGDFTGVKNDTISLRLPAYAPARKRALRSGAARTKDNINERKVDVSLDVDVYKDVPISDEKLTLDIADFGGQVLNPVLLGIATQLDQEVADEITGATYETTIAHVIGTDDVYKTAVKARTALNDANIPFEGRSLLVGSALEAEFLNNSKFIEADKSGTTQTLREALIGRVAGFNVYTSNAIPGVQAYAFHKTAYVMSQRAPVVPAGAPWGASQSFMGMAIRTLRIFDPDLVEDRFLADAWCGTNVVTDDGYYDSTGKFVPTTEPGVTTGPTVTLATSAAADDILDTTTAHGYKVGDQVVFSGLAGGAGLTAGTTYYVIAANLAAQTFQVSATPGGSAVNFTTDITAGTVNEKARSLLVRAVKIQA